MKRKLIGMLAVLLLAGSLALGGCNQQTPDNQADNRTEADPSAVTGTLVVGGSTSVYEVAVILAEQFMEINPGVVVETHSQGSTAGIVGANEGTYDIGMSSRDLSGDEPGWGLREFLICKDAIAPIVHRDNPVVNLTMDQLRQIFLGEITNWSEVGGSDLPITVIIREDGSGTRDAWEDIIHEDIDPVPTLILTGTGGVKSGVAGDPSAISYITVAALDESVRALQVNGVEPTADAVLGGKYAIARPYLFLTKDDPSPLAQKFIDFVLGPEGQSMLEDEGMVRVN